MYYQLSRSVKRISRHRELNIVKPSNGKPYVKKVNEEIVINIDKDKLQQDKLQFPNNYANYNSFNRAPALPPLKVMGRGDQDPIYKKFGPNWTQSCRIDWPKIPETLHDQEKCVDIALAIEMLYMASVPDAYDIAVLVTGDKDFIPAMQKTRLKAKRVVLCSKRNSCNKDFIVHGTHRDLDVIWLDDYLDILVVPKRLNIEESTTIAPAALPTNSISNTITTPTEQLTYIEKDKVILKHLITFLTEKSDSDGEDVLVSSSRGIDEDEENEDENDVETADYDDIVIKSVDNELEQNIIETSQVKDLEGSQKIIDNEIVDSEQEIESEDIEEPKDTKQYRNKQGSVYVNGLENYSKDDIVDQIVDKAVQKPDSLTYSYYSALTVKQLKILAKELKVVQRGSKEELINRLSQHDSR
eukprot:gene17239-22765_t